MKKLLNDYEEKILATEEAALTFFEEQKANDVWQRIEVPSKELKVLPLPNVPIAVQQIMDELHIEGISSESVVEGMEDKRLVLSFPLEKMVARPVRYTGFKTLCERAGLTGPALTCYDEKARQKEMEPEKKATVLNYGLECFNSKALVLLRDEKVSAVLSGDEKDYSPLPVYDLLNTLKDGLASSFENVEYVTGCVTHEYATVTYAVKDAKTKKMFNDILGKVPFTVRVSLTTSDVGLSGANLLPVINTEGKDIVVGNEISLTHKHGHSIADFKTNVEYVFACLQESAEKVKEMQSIKITNPLGCFKALCCKLGLPKAESLEVADFFEATMPEECTAFDVYWGMWDIMNTYELSCKAAGKVVNLSKKLSIQENISRVLKMNIKEYDRPFEWL